MTCPSPAGQLGQPSTACAAGTIGLVKNEPALRLSGSAGSSTMPLPRRSSSTAARTSASGAVSPISTPSRAGQLGVADRPRQPAPASQREGDVEDDEPAGLPLEPAVAVGEAALGRGQRALGLLRAVVDADGGDRLRDLLAVGADVLHRRRAGRPGDARQRLHAGQPVRRRCRRPGRPSRSPAWTVSAVAVALDPAAAHGDDVPGPALVRRDHVGAAAEQRAAGARPRRPRGRRRRARRRPRPRPAARSGRRRRGW